MIDKDSSQDELPSERTLRDTLNRKNYRLKRLQKGKPLNQEEPVLFGNLMLATGAWMLLLGSRVTSAAWVDALRWWWRHDRAGLGHVRRLVVSLDNGPKNPGRRAQFVERMVQCADWSGLEIRLVYDPPFSSRYNPIERC